MLIKPMICYSMIASSKELTFFCYFKVKR